MGKSGKKSMLRRIVVDSQCIFILQALITILFAIGVKRLDILPMYYFMGFVIILVLLCAVPFMMSMKKYKLSSRIISLVLSVVLLITNIAVLKSDRLISSVSGADEEFYTLSVVVLKSSHIDTIEDLKGKQIGFVSRDEENNTYFKQQLKSLKKQDTREVLYDTMDDMVLALYDKQVSAIVINESQRSLLTLEDKDLEKDTKIIWQVERVVKVSEGVEPGSTVNEPFTVFISGIDQYGRVSEVRNCDVNMLVTVNPITHQVLLTSIPRDYYVLLPSKGQKDKLTHAGNYGVSESMKALENLFDINIDYYVKVNFTSVVDIIEAIGGIEVYSDRAFIPDSRKEERVVEGWQHMDGDLALAFARERYAYPDGDNQRVRNQQTVLKAVIKKVLSPSIITNYASLLDALEGCFETSMSSRQLKQLIQKQIRTMASWEFLSCQVSGFDGSEYTFSYPHQELYVMIPDEKSVEKCSGYIHTIMANEILDLEGSESIGGQPTDENE